MIRLFLCRLVLLFLVFAGFMVISVLLCLSVRAMSKSNKFNPFQLRASECRGMKGFSHVEDGLAVFISRSYAVRAAYVLVFCRYRRQGLRTVHDVTEMFWHGGAELYFAFLDKVLCEMNRVFPKNRISFTLDEDVSYFPLTYLYALSVALGAGLSIKDIEDVIRAYDLHPLRLTLHGSLL